MKALDIIIDTHVLPNKPHADMVACGYKFVCSHISINALQEQDSDLPTNSHVLFAVPNDHGVNFYESSP
jgi:hypothetical protein